MKVTMRRDMRLDIVLIFMTFLLGSVSPSPVLAADTTPITQVSTASMTSVIVSDPIHHVITQQLQAFKDRDGLKAFALVSTALKDKYHDSGKFLRMARFTYRALYDHKGYNFLKRSGEGQIQFQSVEVTGPDGTPSVALFRMVQDANGSWLIDRVIVLDEEGQPI